MIYPGTHDNDTTVGWWETSSTPEERAFALRYLDKADGSDIAWDLARLALGVDCQIGDCARPRIY